MSGVAAASGTERREKQNARKRQIQKEDKLQKVREGGYNTPWTLAAAVILCIACAFRGKNGADPYPADSEEQIAHWNKQKRDKIQPAKRTLLMDITGCKHGTKEYSPTITTMQNSGKTAEQAAERWRKGHEARSRTQVGHDQQNAVEGNAIHLLLALFQLVASFCDWEAMPVFDGNEADFTIRKKDWPPDVWVPVQMKSVSECVVGKHTSYNLKKGDYPNVFCVCVGLQGYVHRTDDVVGPNDIANAPGCSIAEIWNIGSCSIIETSLGPSFGTPYSKLSAERRLHFPGATDEAKLAFAETLLRDIEAWPRMELSRILYEFTPAINSTQVGETRQTEKAGFATVDAALRVHGLYVAPVWRQNECVDYAVASVETGEPLVFVSGKTGSVNNGKIAQRYFLVRGALNKRFCDVVVASYAGAHHKVAVMSRDTAYVQGMVACSWNEECLKDGVRVFDDIRDPKVGKAFVDYLLMFRVTN